MSDTVSDANLRQICHYLACNHSDTSMRFATVASEIFRQPRIANQWSQVCQWISAQAKCADVELEHGAQTTIVNVQPRARDTDTETQRHETRDIQDYVYVELIRANHPAYRSERRVVQSDARKTKRNREWQAERVGRHR